MMAVENLRVNKTLKKAIFCSNKIAFEGADKLGNVMKDNTCLEYLDVSFNTICHDGMRSIAESLRYNNTLLHLQLNTNSMADYTGRVVAFALKVSFVVNFCRPTPP